MCWPSNPRRIYHWLEHSKQPLFEIIADKPNNISHIRALCGHEGEVDEDLKETYHG